MIVALGFMVSLVIFRSRQMKKLGIETVRFGQIDKKDFLIPPFVFFWGIQSFGKSFCVGIDVDKSGGFVTTGAFSFSRNPLYVAFFMILAEVFLIFPTWIFFMYFVAGIWLIDRQVCREENSLRHIFGKEYKYYCEKVRRDRKSVV